MAEPSHWLGVGRRRTTEDDKLPGSDHPHCPYRPISGTAMEISVYTLLRYLSGLVTKAKTNQTNQPTNQYHYSLYVASHHKNPSSSEEHDENVDLRTKSLTLLYVLFCFLLFLATTTETDVSPGSSKSAKTHLSFAVRLLLVVLVWSRRLL